MFRIDTGVTLADLRALQQSLQQVQDRRSSLVRETAQFGVNHVRERIQLSGRNAEGKIMINSSGKRVGRYSEWHGTVRQKEGKRTDIIDLTFTGELLNSESWTVLQEDDETFGAGFRENDMSQRAGFLEEFFGPVFQLSMDEEESTVEYFNNGISDLVNATF